VSVIREQIIEGAREGLREAMRPLYDERERLWAQMARGEFVEPLWGALTRAGTFAAAQAGASRGLPRAAAALEALGEAGFLVLFPAITIAGAACVEKHGAPALRETMLPAVATGSCRICFGVTEARAGFNLLEVESTARADGDAYVLSGEKCFVSGFDVAHEMLFLARTRSLDEVVGAGLPRAAGLSLFLVPTGAAGARAEALPIRGENMVRPHLVTLREVRVPRERLIGEPDQGFAALAAGFNIERILMASVMLGAARHCLDAAVGRARNRKVFDGQPIGSYQAIQHPLADVRIRLASLELLVDKAVRAVIEGAPVREIEFLANAAKYLASEVGLKAVDCALQTFGGHGFDERQGIIQMWDAMRLLKISPISSELILNRVGSQILGLPRA
jgi:acyl-CoA dehydrogenase